MRIGVIKYERKKNLGDYENVTIAAEAILEATDSPEKVFRELKLFVKTKLKKEK